MTRLDPGRSYSRASSRRFSLDEQEIRTMEQSETDQLGEAG